MPDAALTPETILERVSDERGFVGDVTVADVVRDAQTYDPEMGAAAVAALDAGDRETLLAIARDNCTSPSMIRPGFVGGFVTVTPGIAEHAPRHRLQRRQPRARSRRSGARRTARRRGPPRPRRADDESDLAERGDWSGQRDLGGFLAVSRQGDASCGGSHARDEPDPDGVPS